MSVREPGATVKWDASVSVQEKQAYFPRQAPIAVEEQQEIVVLKGASSHTLSSASLLSVFDSVTACSDASVTSIDDQIEQRCSLWQCPLCTSTPETVECVICLQKVNPASLLPCRQCRQAACVLCHLRSLAANSYVDLNHAAWKKAACSFCRTPYTLGQLNQLSAIHNEHRDMLDQPIFHRTEPSAGAIHAHFNALHDTVEQRVDDIRVMEMGGIEASRRRERRRLRVVRREERAARRRETAAANSLVQRAEAETWRQFQAFMNGTASITEFSNRAVVTASQSAISYSTEEDESDSGSRVSVTIQRARGSMTSSSSDGLNSDQHDVTQSTI